MKTNLRAKSKIDSRVKVPHIGPRPRIVSEVKKQINGTTRIKKEQVFKPTRKK